MELDAQRVSPRTSHVELDGIQLDEEFASLQRQNTNVLARTLLVRYVQAAERLDTFDLFLRRNIGVALVQLQEAFVHQRGRGRVQGAWLSYARDLTKHGKEWIEHHLRFGKQCLRFSPLVWLSRAVHERYRVSLSWTKITCVMSQLDAAIDEFCSAPAAAAPPSASR